MDHITIAVAQELERAFGGWTPPEPLPPIPAPRFSSLCGGRFACVREPAVHPSQGPNMPEQNGVKFPLRFSHSD